MASSSSPQLLALPSTFSLSLSPSLSGFLSLSFEVHFWGDKKCLKLFLKCWYKNLKVATLSGGVGNLLINSMFLLRVDHYWNLLLNLHWKEEEEKWALSVVQRRPDKDSMHQCECFFLNLFLFLSPISTQLHSILNISLALQCNILLIFNCSSFSISIN